MAKNYWYCDGLDMLFTSVNFTIGTIETLAQSWTNPNQIHREYSIEVTASIPTALDVDVVVNILNVAKFYVKGVFQYDIPMTATFTILAGSTFVTNTMHSRTYDNYLSINSVNETYSEYTLLDQVSLPVGCTQGDCTYAVTLVSGSTTPTSIRGGDDGTISIVVDGFTGTTVDYYLNGVYIATSNITGYTYQNLEEGTYTVKAQQNGCFAQGSYTVNGGDFRTGDFNYSKPSIVVAAHSPVVYNVNTYQRNVEGLKAIHKFTINDVEINDGFKITINLTTPYVYQNTFIAKSFPNKKNYFLCSEITDIGGNYLGFNNQEEITLSLYDALNNDNVLPIYYDIYYSNNEITLTSKLQGYKYTIDETKVNIDDTSIVFETIQEGQDKYDGEAVENYSIYAEVYVNNNIDVQYPSTGNDSDYVKVSELVLPYQYTNQHVFNISDIVKSYVDTPVPSFNFTGSTIQIGYMKPIYLRLGESYPMVANTSTIKKRYKTQTSKVWVTNASLNNLSTNNMISYTASNLRKFLTLSPNPLPIQRQQSLFLSLILEKDFGYPLLCKGDIYYWDGTNDSDITFFNISNSSINAGGVFMFNLSYDKLGLASYEYNGGDYKKIKRIETHIAYTDGGDDIQLSEVRSFNLNINEQPRKYNVIFQNSLGTYDSIDFVGVVENTLDRKTQSIQYNVTPTNDGAYMQGFKHNANINTTVTKKIVVNTGYINTTVLDWLSEELIKSNNIYTLTTQGQMYLKLVDYKYTKSSLDDLFDMEFTFMYTTSENNVNE